MLRAVPMAHFRAQVAIRDAPAVTRAIAAEGLLHLVDIAHGRTPYDAAPPGTRELHAAFRDLASRIRIVCERLDVAPAEPEGALSADLVEDFTVEREQIAAALEPIEKKADELTRTLSSARERESSTRQQLEIAERLAAADVDLTRIVSVRFAVLRLVLAKPDALPAIASMLAPAPFAIVPLDSGEPQLVAIATASFARARLDEAIRVAGVQPLTIQTASTEKLRRTIDEARSAAADARAALAHERDAHANTLVALARRAELLSLLLGAQTHFAAAGRFVVISGWVPAESAERIRAHIRDATAARAIVDIEAAESLSGVAEGSIRVPILHRNPLLLRPFQRLVDVYGTASYREVQPTAFFGISFLLMFGLMFGDVGHGAILFSAGWMLLRYIPQYLDYGILLMEAGASSALFGVLYGSVFGAHGVLPTLWLQPMDDLPRFMVIAAGLGVVVITAGLLLNVVNTWRAGNIRDALVGTRGLAGTLFYWITLVLVVRLFVTDLVLPKSVIIVLAAAATVVMIGGRLFARRFEAGRPQPPVRTTPIWLVALEGGVELVDTLFSYFANTISFVRVAAFAAVHAGVFIAIFALADTISRMHGGGVLSIAVHVAGNALVILLEGLTVSVQVLRLEYYEFFGKFFRGGGEPYRPLALERKHAA